MVAPAPPIAASSAVVGAFGPYSAGSPGEFALVARDSFGNLRQEMDADLAGCQLMLLATSGAVFDNVPYSASAPPAPELPGGTAPFSFSLSVTPPEPGTLVMAWRLGGEEVLDPATLQQYRTRVAPGNVSAAHSSYDAATLVAAS
eukprot:7747624-Pyramimonas_sp.AAC.1